ncbi:MAG: hypothetical protein ABJA66_11325 [Actinomycetota bacterium]
MENFRILFVLLILCLFVNNSCFSSSRQITTETSNSNAAQTPTTENSKDESGAKAAATQGEIRKVDFKNFTFEPNCTGEDTQKITVKKGEYTLDKGDDKLYFTVENVTYGDLSGDKDDEAIILTVCNTGGTGQFSEGFIYGMKDGKPELLARIEGGDRADGGLRMAKVENGLLVVERNGAGETGGACCPEFVVTSKYKLEGKNLKQVGGDQQRELYPPQRVKFEKGATETTLNVKLTNDDDIKRFSIGAQSGQTLTVSSSAKDVSLTLLKGEAKTIEDGNRLQVELKKSGDFLVQVQKLGDKNVNASITIGIQ